VPHDADWTYSLAFPSGHPWYDLAAIESYRRIHEWIQAAFAKMGVATELASSSAARAGPSFVGYEKSDVLWNGLKIAGPPNAYSRGFAYPGIRSVGDDRAASFTWETAMRAVGSNFITGMVNL